MNIRNDLHVMRFLHEFAGDKALSAWKRTPYIVAPEEGFADHLLRWMHADPDTRKLGTTEGSLNPINAIEHTPWDEFVLDMNPAVLAAFLPDGHPSRRLTRSLLLRVMTPHAAIRHAETFPWLSWMLHRTPQGQENTRDDICMSNGYRIIEDYSYWAFEFQSSHRGAAEPNLLFLSLRNPSDIHHINAERADDPIPKDNEAAPKQAGLTLVAANFMAYLSACDEYLVERKPIIPREKAAKAAKTAVRKPWLDERLPHVILIHPGHVREFHEQPQRPPDPAAHASPRPHLRRGHRRTLRADRFLKKGTIWIKPAWIGETQWICDGQTYRVLPLGPRAEQET